MVERKPPVPEEIRSTPSVSDYVKVRKHGVRYRNASVRLAAVSNGHRASGSGR